MKKRIFLFLLALALCLTACQTEPPAVSTDPTTVPTQTTAAPTQNTVPPETTVPPTTSILKLTCYADVVYAQDDREGSLEETLPEGYVYVGVIFSYSEKEQPVFSHPLRDSKEGIRVFSNPLEPDYLYVQMEKGWQRMIRAGLVEDYWNANPYPKEPPKNYTLRWFEELMNKDFYGISYNHAVSSWYSQPEDVDLGLFFYNGYDDEDKQGFSFQETDFLKKAGWDEQQQIGASTANRYPVHKMNETLQQFFGLNLSQTSGVGLDTFDFYWNETDCYYSKCANKNINDIRVESVTCEKDSVYTVRYTIKNHQQNITGEMKLHGKGRYLHILSNQPAQTIVQTPAKACYADVMYVQDDRMGSLEDSLPEGYVYVGLIFDYFGDEQTWYSHPARDSKDGTRVYSNPLEPDYLYLRMEDGWQRMIRAGMVENYWNEEEYPQYPSKNFMLDWFDELMNKDMIGISYNHAAASWYSSPEDVDLSLFFYNGYYEEDRVRLTEGETAFLKSDGWNEQKPPAMANRLPVRKMNETLQQFFGISLSETNGVGLDVFDSYWSQTDCYYDWCSDVFGEDIHVESVTFDEAEGVFAVRYTKQKKTGEMKLQAQGEYLRILSNQQIS